MCKAVLVNFVFFQKSIFVLKIDYFFLLSNTCDEDGIRHGKACCYVGSFRIGVIFCPQIEIKECYFPSTADRD